MSLRKLIGVFAIIAGLLFTVQCGKKESAVDEAYKVLKKKLYDEAAPPEEIVAEASRFLERFPKTERTGRVLGISTYYLTEEMGEPERALDLVSTVMGRVRDPEILK